MAKTQLHRNQFTFYRSYFESVEHLPKTRRYEVLRALILYALDGEEPEALNTVSNGVFAALRPNLDNGRAKASARLKELAEENSDSPSGSNKKKKENKKENKNKNKNENKNEDKNEVENEDKNQSQSEVKTEDESASETAPASGARRDGSAAGAAGALSSGETEGDELSRLIKREPAVERVVTQLLRHWENVGQPLTGEERKIMAWSLAVHSPEEQKEAVYDALFQNRRQVRFSS